ncbi:phosphotransferase [Chromobacterium haemolyticum]|nr:phosphotransferase [Chromobacterium haemolyticum]
MAGQFRLAPRPLAVDEDGDAALLLVEKLEGVAPAACGPLAPDTVRRLAENFIGTLASLHALEVAPVDRPPDYLRRILSEWRRRWNAEEAGGAIDADFSAVADWLTERMPETAPAAWLHNDYKLDNILVDPGDPARVVGVVDWELAAVGHPLADLGAALAYWIENRDSSLLRLDAPGPSCAPGAPTREALVDLYAAAAGREVTAPAYWYAYGLLRLAVITQQLALRRRDEGQRVPRAQADRALAAGPRGGSLRRRPPMKAARAPSHSFPIKDTRPMNSETFPMLFDVVVIGGSHAGQSAALQIARARAPRAGDRCRRAPQPLRLSISRRDRPGRTFAGRDRRGRQGAAACLP